MSESSDPAHDVYRRRARVGLIALGLRSVLQQVVIYGAYIYLAWRLERSEFGVFQILNAALLLMNLLGDAGLAASLIQKDETPSQRDLSTIWWMQLGLSLSLILLAAAFSPLLPLVFEGVGPSGPWLLIGMSVALLFTMLRATPFLLMERELHFQLISLLEFLGTLVFYGTAVTAAALDGGTAALVGATVAQAAVIAIAANIVRPFYPSWVFDRSRAKELLSFGLRFQGPNLIGFLSTAAVEPILVGTRMGTDALGVVNFARKTAGFPEPFLGIIRKVSFPYFSRLRSDPAGFAREYENATVLGGFPVFFSMALFLGVGPSIIDVVFPDKWLVALPALYVYVGVWAVMFYGWIGGAALEALGEVGVLLRFVAIGAVVNWVVTTTAVVIDPSPVSFAIGFSAHVVFINVSIFWRLRSLVPGASPLRRLALLAGLGLGLAGAARWLLPETLGPLTLLGWTALALVVYVGAAAGLDSELRASLLRLIRKQKAAPAA